MSKAAKGGNSDIVALPTLPKFDEKIDRSKWCQDYDKIESDLMRNHLGNETVTLGLRSFGNTFLQHSGLPADSAVDFNRTLPRMDEPTEADKLEAIRAASRKPRASSSMAGGGAQQQQQRQMHQQRAMTTDGSYAAANNAAGGRGGVYSVLSMRDDVSSIGGVSPVRQQRHRALSPAFSSVTRCMTALDSTYNGGRSSSSAAQHNTDSSIAGGNTAVNTTSGSSGAHGDPLKSTDMCVKLLDTLLHPPPSYKNSFRLNLDGIDLSWMWHYAADRAPPQLLTLETLRDDANVSRSTTVINSPRSVMVMLRNGVSAFQLVQRSAASFERADVDPDAAHAASVHFEERRKAMLSSLRGDYREVCSNVLLHEVVRGLQLGHKTHVAEEKARSSPLRKRSSHRSASPSINNAASSASGGAAAHYQTTSGDDEDGESGFAAQRRQKMQRLADKSRQKMQKQMDALEALKRELAEAEARQKINEKLLVEREQDRKRGLEERSATAAKHFAEMREKANLYNVAHIAELERRRVKMEAKAAAKFEAQLAKSEQLKQESEIKAASKAKRLQQNRATIAALQEEEAQRQAEKDIKAAEKRDQLERRRIAEREEAYEAQRKLVEQRQDAQERVKLQRAAFLERAAAREREVRERLEAFRESEKHAREAAHQIEMAKETKRIQTIAAAESIVRNKSQSIVEKREDHMRSLEQTKLQRDEAKKLQMIQERNEIDDKRFLVNRQANGDEFKKLLRAVRMIDKEGQARYIAEQKARSLEVAAAEREKLRLQKEAAAARIARM